jgi:hypothetical protein
MYANLAAAGAVFFQWSGVAWSGAGEAAASIPMPAAGRVLMLRVKCSFNAGDTASVFTVRKAGANTDMTVTVTAGSTSTFTDETHIVGFAKGDLITIGRPAPGGSGAIDANVTMLYEFY